MTYAVSLNVVHMRAIEVLGSGTGVTTSALTGLEVAGQMGALVGSATAVIALVVGVAAGNAKRRRQYTEDLTAAEARGAASRDRDIAEVERDRDAAARRADEFEARYLNLIEERAGLPPRRRPPRTPSRGDDGPDRG